MSSHYRIGFDQMVQGTLFFISNTIETLVEKAGLFLMNGITHSLNLHSQFNEYQGKAVKSFWQKSLGALPKLTLPNGRTIVKTEINNKGRDLIKEMIEKLTPEQAVVLERIRGAAEKHGFEVKALPSPSDDLIIDIFVRKDGEKVYAKRRQNETHEDLHL